MVLVNDDSGSNDSAICQQSYMVVLEVVVYGCDDSRSGGIYGGIRGKLVNTFVILFESRLGMTNTIFS